MGIEPMFKDCPKGLALRRKSGGYNLEQCQSKDKRLPLNRWVIAPRH